MPIGLLRNGGVSQKRRCAPSHLSRSRHARHRRCNLRAAEGYRQDLHRLQATHRPARGTAGYLPGFGLLEHPLRFNVCRPHSAARRPR
jgi:hypothetical protein